MDTPTNRNRNIMIASAVVVVVLLLAAGVIGMRLASDGDDDGLGGRGAQDTTSTPTVPTPTTIDGHRSPTDERLVAAVAAPSLVDLATTDPGADGEATTTDVAVDEDGQRGDGHADPVCRGVRDDPRPPGVCPPLRPTETRSNPGSRSRARASDRPTESSTP